MFEIVSFFVFFLFGVFLFGWLEGLWHSLSLLGKLIASDSLGLHFLLLHDYLQLRLLVLLVGLRVDVFFRILIIIISH